MSRYMYKVRDGRGELSTGVVEGASLEDAGSSLRSQGKFIVKITQIDDGEHTFEDAGPTRRKKITRTDVMVFAHQMAVMIETGVPISEALDCVVDQCPKESFKTVLADVAERVQAGNEFSRALQEHPKVFPTIMTSLIRAAEVSGKLGTILERVAQYLAKEQAVTRKIRGALTYPAIMLSLVGVVTIFLLTFVLPRFAGIYESRGATLPAPTQFLMALSNLLTEQWQMLGGTLLLVVIAGFMFMQSPSSKTVFDFLKLNMPLIGPLFSKLYLTRACRTMGTMLAAGVPILEMVGIVRNVTENTYFDALWDEVDQGLQRGSQLSAPFFQSNLVPRSVAQMIYSGEKAGRVGSVMEKIAEFTEEEFDERVRQTTQYIEPLMVITMGLIIGFVAIALLLPIFNVGRVVGSG